METRLQTNTRSEAWEAQRPLLEGSCRERSLDWRQERWETGWLGSQHYCGTAGVTPTEQHRVKDHGTDGRSEHHRLLEEAARNHPLQQFLAKTWSGLTEQLCCCTSKTTSIFAHWWVWNGHGALLRPRRKIERTGILLKAASDPGTWN